MVKDCDLDLKNAALSLRPRAAYSGHRSQFFTIRTSQPANNTHIYMLLFINFLWHIVVRRSHKPLALHIYRV